MWIFLHMPPASPILNLADIKISESYSYTSVTAISQHYKYSETLVC